MKIFICGSHTDVGKTAISAALCAGFNLDYFKLIQAGTPTDCSRVAELLGDLAEIQNTQNEIDKIKSKNTKDSIESTKHKNAKLNADSIESEIESKKTKNAKNIAFYADSIESDNIKSKFTKNKTKPDSIESEIKSTKHKNAKSNVDSIKSSNIESKNSAKKIKIYPPEISLKMPASPHIAAFYENLKYNGLKIQIPNSQNLLIECAGGLFSPLDFKNTMIDFAAQMAKTARKLSTDSINSKQIIKTKSTRTDSIKKAQNLQTDSINSTPNLIKSPQKSLTKAQNIGFGAILVGRYYLGGINHILLSLSALKQRKIPILGTIISDIDKINKKERELSDSFISEYFEVKIAHFSHFAERKEFLKNAQTLKEQVQKWL